MYTFLSSVPGLHDDYDYDDDDDVDVTAWDMTLSCMRRILLYSSSDPHILYNIRSFSASFKSPEVCPLHLFEVRTLL
jgi:hypothetical protein